MMHSNVVLSSLLAGSQLAAAIALPSNVLRREAEEVTYWGHRWHAGSWHSPGSWPGHTEKHPDPVTHKPHPIVHHPEPSHMPHPEPTHTHHPIPTGHHPVGSHPTGGQPAGYATIVTNQHNVHRANHSAHALVWNEDLAQIAEGIAKSCTFAHNTAAGGGGYGQNLRQGRRR